MVFDIQRFSLHDGPGIRTTVFLKGCPLRCLWCHNPESFVAGQQLAYNAGICTGCGLCAEVCPHGVHSFVRSNIGFPQTHKVDFAKCQQCGACIEQCPAKALKFFGTSMSSNDVIAEVLQDSKYYASSGGGITISGGEPTLQFDFLMELLGLSKQHGLHAVVETYGLASVEKTKQLAELTDLFLIDYKVTGEERHKELTGMGNARLYDTLAFLSKIGKPVVLRCPIIPTINDTSEHFDAILKLQSTYSCIEKLEVMPYHSIGVSKWKSTGQDYSLLHLENPTEKDKKKWEELLHIS